MPARCGRSALRGCHACGSGYMNCAHAAQERDTTSLQGLFAATSPSIKLRASDCVYLVWTVALRQGQLAIASPRHTYSLVSSSGASVWLGCNSWMRAPQVSQVMHSKILRALCRLCALELHGSAACSLLYTPAVDAQVRAHVQYYAMLQQVEACIGATFAARWQAQLSSAELRRETASTGLDACLAFELHTCTGKSSRTYPRDLRALRLVVQRGWVPMVDTCLYANLHDRASCTCNVVGNARCHLTQVYCNDILDKPQYDCGDTAPVLDPCKRRSLWLQELHRQKVRHLLLF